MFRRVDPNGRTFGKPVRVYGDDVRFRMKPIDESAFVIPGGADAQTPRPALARTIKDTWKTIEGWKVNANGAEVLLSDHKDRPEVGRGQNSVNVYISATPNSSSSGTLDFTVYIAKGGRPEVVYSKTTKVKWSGDNATDARLWEQITSGILKDRSWVMSHEYEDALKEMGHQRPQRFAGLRQIGHPNRKSTLAVLNRKTAHPEIVEDHVMSRSLTAADRKSLIRLASSFPRVPLSGRRSSRVCRRPRLRRPSVRTPTTSVFGSTSTVENSRSPRSLSTRTGRCIRAGS